MAGLVLAACSACSGSPDRDEEQGGPQGTALAGRVLNDSAALALPAKIAVVGAYVVVVDAAGSPAVHVIKAGSGRLARSFGRKGGGPGEFQAAREIDPVPGSATRFWLYDLQLKRLSLIDLDRALADPLHPAERSVRFHAGQLPLDPAWAGTNIVSPGIFRGGRLGIFDGEGALVRTAGPLPPAPEGTPENVVQHAFTGPLAARPDGSRVALATRHADRLDIYRSDGTLAATVRGERGFEPLYETRRLNGVPYMATGDDLRFGYVELSATQDRIYALFSGRRRRDYPGRASFGQTVHVFDWSGRRLATYALDAETLSISADPDGTRLYAVRRDPAPAVLVYDLPAGSSGPGA